MSNPTNPTLREQLKGIRTGSRVAIHPGVPDYGDTFVFIERNRNGCAVFEPPSLREDVFVPLSSTELTVRRLKRGEVA